MTKKVEISTKISIKSTFPMTCTEGVESREKPGNTSVSRLFSGGRYKTRTCDLPHVKRMRYQLRQSSVSARVILAHIPWLVKN